MSDRVANLIMVTEKNNNKYYNMTLNGDTIHIEFGRVGANPQRRTYPSFKWDSLHKAKLRKGYKDCTSLRSQIKSASFKSLPEGMIAQLVYRLQQYASKVVSDTYLVSSDQVTQAQVDSAQAILDSLSSMSGETPRLSNNALSAINGELLELYTTIPRKMKDTKDHLLTSNDGESFDYLLQSEQSKLDAMASQVVTASVEDEVDAPDLTVLDALGLSIQPASASSIEEIKRMLGAESRDKFVNAWEIVNNRTDANFRTFEEAQPSGRANTTHFWHGSRNENWWGILSTGLVLRPTNAVRTGSMFGAGLYFADRAKKSLGYTSCRGSYWANGSDTTGFMGVFQVNLGKQKVLDSFNHNCYSYNAGTIGDFDSVYAKAGVSLRNSEYIVYREEQTTIKYLVELR